MIVGPVLALTLAPGLAGRAGGQTRGVAPESELFRKVAALDAAAFEAYNQCDLEKLGSFFAEEEEVWQITRVISFDHRALR
jgi:hypothetical protein